jgi:hypothetical protein
VNLDKRNENLFAFNVEKGEKIRAAAYFVDFVFL